MFSNRNNGSPRNKPNASVNVGDRRCPTCRCSLEAVFSGRILVEFVCQQCDESSQPAGDVKARTDATTSVAGRSPGANSGGPEHGGGNGVLSAKARNLLEARHVEGWTEVDSPTDGRTEDRFVEGGEGLVGGRGGDD